MDYDSLAVEDQAFHLRVVHYLHDRPVLSVLGKRVLDKAVIPQGKKSFQLTPMGKSHTLQGSNFIPVSLNFDSRGTSPDNKDSQHFEALDTDEVYPNFPSPIFITENEIIRLFTHSHNRSYSVLGYEYISALSLKDLCFLDHFFVKASPRGLIRDTFEEYLRNIKPQPDANEEGAKELKFLYIFQVQKLILFL